ncbi:MAG: NfeD family protein [Microthrixaceae bacterium]
MDDPETMRWVWLIATAVFLGGELLTAGALVLLPFALGTGVAATIAFAGVDVEWQWLMFLLVAIVTSFAFLPLRRRLDRAPQHVGVGAGRLLNQEAVVLETIEEGPTGVGMVRVGRETWRATSGDGRRFDIGTHVTVTSVEGTGVVVTERT